MSEPWDWNDEPTDNQLGALLLDGIREYYHEGMWEDIVELMDTVKRNDRLSRYLFFEAHGFLSEVYDWYYNGDGPKKVCMFDFDMRKNKDKEEESDRD